MEFMHRIFDHENVEFSPPNFCGFPWVLSPKNPCFLKQQMEGTQGHLETRNDRAFFGGGPLEEADVCKEIGHNLQEQVTKHKTSRNLVLL